MVELAVQQKDVDYNLLHLHYQLCLVLHMITKFTVKHSKPVNNLFEASLVNLFFTGKNLDPQLGSFLSALLFRSSASSGRKLE